MWGGLADFRKKAKAGNQQNETLHDLILYCGYLAESQRHARKIHDIAVNDVPRLPETCELRLICSKSGKAEDEVQSLEEVMNDSLSSRPGFVLLETGHGYHAHVETQI